MGSENTRAKVKQRVRKFECSYSTLLFNSLTDCIYVYLCIYIYIYICRYYERKKGRNYISRQACFVNRFTLQGFNV